MPFSDVIGQDRAVEILKRELSHDRISHAYLFSGADRIGKKHTALCFAMAAQCDRIKEDSCGECPVCRKIEQGTHPDVRITTPVARTKGATEKIYIDQIRTLQEEISLCPMEGKKKVFIIDDADRMVEQAANALLKTLEEPPGDSLLILVTAYPDHLAPTVLSRCRTVQFRPLSESAVARILMEKKGLTEEQAARMARFAQGQGGHIPESDEEELFSQRDRFLDWMHGCDLQQIDSIFNVSERFAGNASEAMDFVEFLLSWTRDLISMKVRGDRGPLVHGDKAPDLAGESRTHGLSELLKRTDILEEALGRLKRNVNQRLALEQALVQIGRE